MTAGVLQPAGQLALRPVDPQSTADLAFLYAVLSRRLDEPDTNISHASLPPYDEHCKFVRGRPYLGHYVLSEKGLNVGVAYMTKGHEIGLWVAPEHRREGIGAWALRAIMRVHRNDHWLANINAENSRSCDFFARNGFIACQETLIDGTGVKMLTYIRNKAVEVA
jgi:GNAT superfamily N-acetyltransferase